MSAIALVTTDLEPIGEFDEDLPIQIEALTERGLTAEAAHWSDPSVNWAGFDLIVMRSPWDYPERLDEFLAWLQRASTAAPVLNCPDLIRWNLDKAYLGELAARGVPVVPTAICDLQETALAAIASAGAEQVVIKPNVSAGSRNTGRFRADDPAAATLAAEILGLGKRVMVQPCIPGVAADGERALIYFDGEFSHAIRKGPILELGGGLRGGRYIEEISAARATEAEIAVADAAATAISDLCEHHAWACGDSTPLYARFDIVATQAGPQLLEAELFEPSYFLATADGATERFCEAVTRRLAGAA